MSNIAVSKLNNEIISVTITLYWFKTLFIFGIANLFFFFLVCITAYNYCRLRNYPMNRQIFKFQSEL